MDGSNTFRNCVCQYAEDHEWGFDGNVDQLCDDGWISWLEAEVEDHYDRVFHDRRDSSV